ncbi:MAG: hypothetical protein AAB433_16115, partial [Nitrospirota bacterium]
KTEPTLIPPGAKARLDKLREFPWLLSLRLVCASRESFMGVLLHPGTKKQGHSTASLSAGPCPCTAVY